MSQVPYRLRYTARQQEKPFATGPRRPWLMVVYHKSKNYMVGKLVHIYITYFQYYDEYITGSGDTDTIKKWLPMAKIVFKVQKLKT